MAIKQAQPFSTASFFAEPGKGQTLIKYRKNQVVFCQGEPADAVLFIQKGKLKVMVVSDRGNEAVPAILGPDEFFGEALHGGPIETPVRIGSEASGSPRWRPPA